MSDASPIISLAAAGELGLLRALYGAVLVPARVAEEIQGAERPGAEAFASAGWIRRDAVDDGPLLARLMLDLDRGEAEAIALAIARGADLVLIDERHGRRVAGSFGLAVTGVIGVLLDAKTRGLLREVRPVIDRMRSLTDFRISPSLYRAALEAAGE